MFSVFVDTDYNKRGQTSRTVARAQIQTSCDFDEDISPCYCILGCAYCLHNNALLEPTFNFLVWQHSYSTVSSHLSFFLHKNISYFAQ